MKNVVLITIVFLVLSIIPILSSGAPFSVHLVDTMSLFIAFAIPSLLTNVKKVKKTFLIWIVGAIIGILFWDIFSSFVITKKEILMNWQIVYPLGLISLFLLQVTVKYISDRLELIINSYITEGIKYVQRD